MSVPKRVSCACTGYGFPKQLLNSLTNKPDNFKGGQISEHLKNWKQITGDPSILNMVRGSIIDFTEFVTQHRIPAPINFDKEESLQMDQMIEGLIHKKAIELVSHCHGEFISNVFLRPKKDGSFRLILNLRKLNESVEYLHFKLDTIRTAMTFITPECYMACMDWRDAYYSVSVNPDYRKFLRFLWKGKLYQFTCLVMGLAEAPRKFTKITKPLWATLRQQGNISISYLDDALLVADTYDDCMQNVVETVTLSDDLGFTVHPTKSNLKPSQKVEFLGFIIDSVSMFITLTSTRRDKIKRSCQKIYDRRKCTIRELAQVVGQLVSTEPAFPHAPLFYRNLERSKTKALKRKKGNFEAHIKISQDDKIQLQWWMQNVDTLKAPIQITCPDILLRSDSSDYGWGGVVMEKKKGKLVPTLKTRGVWSEIEAKHHINFKELKAAFFVLVCFCENLSDVHVKLECDNTTAISYINKMGGKFRHLHDLARQIWSWARAKNIWITAVHLAGVLNTDADLQSRDISKEDIEWQLHPDIFKKIDKLWGPLQIDLFATRVNTQLRDFISWLPDPEAISTNAFLVPWNNCNSYAFPPFSIINRVLQKVEAEKAELILVAPIWPTQTWYPKILKLCVDYPRKLHVSSNVRLLRLPQKLKKRHPLLPRMRMAVFKLSGDPSVVREFRQKQWKLCSRPGGHPLKNNIGHISSSGWFSVGRNTWIPFQPI